MDAPSMPLRIASLPFVLRREQGVVGSDAITSTRDTLHGLLHLDGERLHVQWRTSREISRVGPEIRTDHELAPLREVAIPLTGLADTRVQRRWHRWWFADVLVLTASDLRAFEALAGEGEAPGLVLEHPAEIVLHVRRADRQRARDFASELRLAVSEAVLASLEEAHRQALPHPPLALDDTEETPDSLATPARRQRA